MRYYFPRDMTSMGIALVYRRKTWQEKLADRKGYPKVLELEEGFPCYRALHKMGAEAGDRVVLVNASEVLAYMRMVPYGQITTLREICDKLSGDHKVKACCTLTSGIHVMTAANAAAEQGKELDVPYWRTLKIGGYLNEKYPGGIEAHGSLLRKEGFEILGKGKASRVKDIQEHLFQF
jgi:alkylated DNA nucleotide flippase Atl1